MLTPSPNGARWPEPQPLANPGRFKPFAPPRTATGTYTGPSKWATCDYCLTPFTVTKDVCPRCATPRCPRRHCACPSSAGERACPCCTLTLDKARFADFADPSTPCRDCA